MSTTYARLFVLAPAMTALAAVNIWLGAATASAGPIAPTPNPPIPGSANAPSRGSMANQPGNDGNTGWGFLPGGAGAQCQNRWVVCGGTYNPPSSSLAPENYDAGGFVSAPGQTGVVCQNRESSAPTSGERLAWIGWVLAPNGSVRTHLRWQHLFHEPQRSAAQRSGRSLCGYWNLRAGATRPGAADIWGHRIYQ